MENSRVELQVRPIAAPTDLKAGSFSSLVALIRAFKARLRESSGATRVTVSIVPPLQEGLTIPIIFKGLVSAWEQHGASRPSFVASVESDDIVDHLVSLLPKAQRLTWLFQRDALDVRITASDLLSAETEAIVNASNRQLRLGGGVSGAIRTAAWPSLQPELSRLAAHRELQDGDCVLTGPHGLPGIKAIIHAAAAAGTAEVLRMAISNTLAVCREHAIRSVAFPALGTGAGGMPMGECARIFCEVLSGLTECPGPRVEVHLIKRSDFQTFVNTFEKYFAKELARREKMKEAATQQSVPPSAGA